MPAMGSQAAAVLAIPPDAIELLDKLDRELLTSDDAEQLFRRLEGPRRRPCDALDALPPHHTSPTIQRHPDLGATAAGRQSRRLVPAAWEAGEALHVLSAIG